MPGGYFQQLAARYLLSQDQERPAAGASQLGALLAGVPQRNATLAGAQAAREQIGTMGAMEQARNAQLKNLALTGLPGALQNMGVPNAPDFANVLASGVNFQGGTAGLGNLLHQSLQRAIATRAASGDIPGANALTIAMTGKPLDQTRIGGNIAYDPNLAPGQQPMTPTPLGQAMIGAQTANAARSYAASAADRARLPLIGAQTNEANANAAKASGGAGADAPTDAQTEAWARKQIASGADPTKLRTYLTTRGYPKVVQNVFGAPTTGVVGIPAAAPAGAGVQ